MPITQSLRKKTKYALKYLFLAHLPDLVFFVNNISTYFDKGTEGDYLLALFVKNVV